MASRATDTFVHMNRVIEIRKVRQIMDPHPLERFPGLKAGPHRFKIRTVSPYLFMTAHTDLSRRHARRCRSLHRCMAIAAINAVVADVVFMTELNGLLTLYVLAGVPARAGDLCGHPKGRKEDKDCAENRSSRQVVRAMTENLWHRRRTILYGWRTYWSTDYQTGGGLVV